MDTIKEAKEVKETLASKCARHIATAHRALTDIAPLLLRDDIYVRFNNPRLIIWPSGEGQESGRVTMRAIYGWLALNGWQVKTSKTKDPWDNDAMEVVFTKDDMSIYLEGWMAKTCRVVEETVTLPAEPAQEARPERTEVRKRIVCDND